MAVPLDSHAWSPPNSDAWQSLRARLVPAAFVPFSAAACGQRGEAAGVGAEGMRRCCCWRSHELLPKDFKHQHKRAEGDDNTDQHYRDFGLRISLRLSFSSGCRV